MNVTPKPTREQYEQVCAAAIPEPWPRDPCISVVPQPAPPWGEPGWEEWYQLSTAAQQAVSWYGSAMQQWENAHYWHGEYHRAIGDLIEI